MRETGLAEVDLVVDHARKQVQAARVDHFVDLQLHGRVDIGDPLVLDHDRNGLNGIGQRDVGILDEQPHAISVARVPGKPKLSMRFCANAVCRTTGHCEPSRSLFRAVTGKHRAEDGNDALPVAVA